MRWLDHLWRRGQEWDARTGSYVRKGWIAERQAMDDAEMERWRQRVAEGCPEPFSTCLACGLMIDLHPHPERMYRSGPDLCAAALTEWHNLEVIRPERSDGPGSQTWAEECQEFGCHEQESGEP